MASRLSRLAITSFSGSFAVSDFLIHEAEVRQSNPQTFYANRLTVLAQGAESVALVLFFVSTFSLNADIVQGNVI